MCVNSFSIEVAEAVIRLDDAAQLAVAGVVEARVGGEHQKSTSLVSPTNLRFKTDYLSGFIKQ